MTSLMWSSWFRLTQNCSGSLVQLQNGHFQFQNALHSQVYSGTTQVSRSVLTSIPWPGTLTSYPPSLLRQLVNKTQQKLRGEISINIYTHYGWNVGATGETWHHKYVNWQLLLIQNEITAGPSSADWRPPPNMHIKASYDNATYPQGHIELDRSAFLYHWSKGWSDKPSTNQQLSQLLF